MTYVTVTECSGVLPEQFCMGDQLAGFDDVLRIAGSVAFVVVLISAAVQYRRRVRDIRRLEAAVLELASNLRAASAKVEVYERMYPGVAAALGMTDGAGEAGSGSE